MQISHPDPRVRPRQIADILPTNPFAATYKTIAYERRKCGACRKITWLRVDENRGLILICSECGYCALEDEEGFTTAPVLPQPRPQKRRKPCAQPTLF